MSRFGISIIKFLFLVVLFLSLFSTNLYYFHINAEHNLEFLEKNADFSEVAIQFFDQSNNPIQNLNIKYKNEIYTTNEDGFIYITNVKKGNNDFFILKNNEETKFSINIESDYIEYKLDQHLLPPSPVEDIIKFAESNIFLISLSLVLDIIIIFISIKSIQSKLNIFQLFSNYKLLSLVLVGILILSAFVMLIFFNRFDTNFTSAAEISSIPVPSNVKAFPDDRMVTLQWDYVPNASSYNIIGYVVRWGKRSEGLFTNQIQTIYNQVHVQPLENGVEYVFSVHSVTGRIQSSVTRDGVTYQGEFAVADGNYSPGVYIIATPTSERIDFLKSKMTAFFDDFNIANGNPDEIKWNTAYRGCSDPGENGYFINRTHVHNKVRARSSYVDTTSDLPYCDRSASASRARAIFDTTGATTSNPAVITMDSAGSPRNRDIWYIDLVPVDARKNGIPVDLVGHNDFFQSDKNDPGRMFRISQFANEISFHAWDYNRNPYKLRLNYTCQGWTDTKVDLKWCDINKNNWIRTNKYSPIPLPDATLQTYPHVRRQWVIEFSTQEIVLFINGIKVASATTPEYLRNITKYHVISEIFSYTTGKDFEFVSPKIKPTMALLDWDNFGFTGPRQNSKVHNYIDGGETGNIPQIATGHPNYPIQEGNRTSKIIIPDEIRSPRQARLMFTINPLRYSTYVWSSNHYIEINGNRYNFPNPNDNINGPAMLVIADIYLPHSTGIIINKDHLVRGENVIKFFLNTDVINVHLELEYDENNAPSYTQPQNVFSSVNYNDFIVPKTRFNDFYLFVEQDMGLRMPLPFPIPPQYISYPIPSISPTVTMTITPSFTSTPIPTNSPIPTSTPFSPTNTPTQTITMTPSITLSPSPTNTPTPTNIPNPNQTILGYNSLGTKLDSGNSNRLTFIKITNGNYRNKINKINIAVKNISRLRNNRVYQIIIYGNYNNRPRNIIYKTRGLMLDQNKEWQTVDLSSQNIVLEPNTTYWIAYNTNGQNSSENVLLYNDHTEPLSSKSTRRIRLYTVPTYPSVSPLQRMYSLYIETSSI